MDSGSDETGNNRAAQRLFNAVSGVLESSLGDGLQATCDVYISDRNGRFIAGCGLHLYRNDAGEVVVREIPTPGR